MSLIEEIREKITEHSEEKYSKFFSALIPNCFNIAGVRIPVLRKMAKEISKSDVESFLINKDCIHMEEKMLKGMVIGLLKDSPENILSYIKNFIPEIDNWAVCDTFCCGLKFIKNNKQVVWDFLQPYLNSRKEYEIRFAVVVLLTYFIDKEYIDKVLEKLDAIVTEDYYAQMAVAWAVSICFVKFEEKTYGFLKNTKQDKFIYNKSIQKIIESNRVSYETKSKLKTMKK